MNLEPRRPILIDTDLSFDDYVALLFLLQHPAMEVRAITVVNGVVHVKPGVENARRLVALVDREIPVAGGPDHPMSGTHTFPGTWRTILDFVPRLFVPRVPTSPPGLSAPELICQQCLSSEQPVSLVMLGPLTNLALALQAEASLASRIDTIYLSGGAVHVPGLIYADLPGNLNQVAEWNVYLDPEAAEVVFKAGIRLVMIPLDVTHVTGPQPLLFSRDFVRRLGAAARGPASNVMIRMIRVWRWWAREFPLTPVWDGVAAAIIAEPELGTDWRGLAIRVVTAPEEVAGQTLVEADQPVNVRVCLGGDQAAFERVYLKVVSAGGG